MFALLTALLALSTPAQADLATVEQAIARFNVDMKDHCDFGFGEDLKRKETAELYTINFPATGDSDAHTVQLFGVWCSQGAYNVNTVYYVATKYTDLALVQFAVPVLGEKDTAVGFSTENMLVNSGFYENNNTLGFQAKGRGMGDCFTDGAYKIERGGSVVLKKYRYDGKCDGKVNPRTIVNFK